MAKQLSLAERRMAYKSQINKAPVKNLRSIVDSKYQIAIYSAAQDVNKNLAILATAGSGKTTTLLKLLRLVPRTRSGIFVSFSKSIIEELESKVPSYIKAKTLHSVGFGVIRDYYRNVKILAVFDKYFKNAIALCKETKSDPKAFLTKEEFKQCKQIESVCAYARMTLTPFNKEDLIKMCTHFNIEMSDIVIERSLILLSKVLMCGKTLWIDYVDMIYLPVMMPSMFQTKYDDVYLDEAQDTNNAQRAMLELMLKPNGRLISVGDDYQCIYGFAGADVDAFKKLRERPNTIVLPLSVSYRCPKSGVRKAKEVCDNIEEWDQAIEGVERDGEWTEIQEGDMVLSRITKPLVSLYFKLIEAHVKANIVGKDIEQGLIDFAERCEAPSKEGVLIKMNERLDRYCEELKKLGVRFPELTPQYAALEEKFQVMQIILGNIDDAYQLIPTIKQIFAEDKQAAKLMTVHRAKGLENKKVFVINKVKGELQMPSKRASQEWERIQERNLMFVSRTRHKEELIFLDLLA